MSAPATAAASTAAPKAAPKVHARERARLPVGPEGDTFEREADRIADSVLAFRPVSLAARAGVPLLPRALPLAPASLDEVLEMPGAPLAPRLRTGMEQRFGHDFGNVRVHIGADAERAVDDLATDACAVGTHIVMREGSLATESAANEHMLAHELAHVVQHEQDPAAPLVVRRYGGTFVGFLANLFQFWDYSKASIDNYLRVLDVSNRIEDDFDSDDKARQVVAEWKQDKARYTLTPRLKVLLVREMLSGSVLGSDQDAILDLLDGTRSTELSEMFSAGATPLTYEEIVKEFGSRKARLELFKDRVLSRLATFKPAPAGSKTANERLDDVESQQGVQFQELALDFRLAPGNLISSFAYSLTVPKGGLTVRVSLTRQRLSVSLRPALLVDVIWPISNAELYGFTLNFAGLKTGIELHGSIELVSDLARQGVRDYLQGLLAGTRFAEPGYDPTHDPDLISELFDNNLIGDINRVKYNFEKADAGKAKKDDSKLPEQMSAPSIYLNLVHTRGIPPGKGWAAVIDPGTAFQLQIHFEATGADLLTKRARFSKLRIESQGIFVYKDNEKIVGITGIEVTRELGIKFTGARAYTDLKEVMKREYPGKLTNFASGAIEFLEIIGGGNVALNLAVRVAEWFAQGKLSVLIGEHWEGIKSALGVTDEQLEHFLGFDEKKGGRRR